MSQQKMQKCTDNVPFLMRSHICKVASILIPSIHCLSKMHKRMPKKETIWVSSGCLCMQMITKKSYLWASKSSETFQQLIINLALCVISMGWEKRKMNTFIVSSCSSNYSPVFIMVICLPVTWCFTAVDCICLICWLPNTRHCCVCCTRFLDLSAMYLTRSSVYIILSRCTPSTRLLYPEQVRRHEVLMRYDTVRLHISFFLPTVYFIPHMYLI